jgi:NADH-quinone oxidoreductase subunit J
VSLADAIAYALGAGALVSSAQVVLRRDAVVAGMNLVLAFFCLSGIYLLLGFPFLATVQVLVYAGAIMVLFLFVIMLLGASRLAPTPRNARTGLGAALAAALGVEAAIVGAHLAAGREAMAESGPAGEPGGAGREIAESVEGVAALLFRDELVLPFEIAGVILLAAIVAVVVLARRDPTAPSLAEAARARAFDPRPIVAVSPPAAAPDGLAAPEPSEPEKASR